MWRTVHCTVVVLIGASFARGQSAELGTFVETHYQRIEQILEQERNMVFKNATLESLVEFLNTLGVPARINHRALDDVGLGADARLTFNQPSIRLRDGLTLALSQYDLTWTVRYGGVVITTQEAHEDDLITRVYDVRNLVELAPVPAWAGYHGKWSAETTYYYDFDSLIDTITSTIRPASWDEVGGPGSIRPYCTRRMRVIVVSQTYHAHKQLSELLRQLSKHGGSQPLRCPAAACATLQFSWSVEVMRSNTYAR